MFKFQTIRLDQIMIVEQSDIQLLSIKIKSAQNIDKEYENNADNRGKLQAITNQHHRRHRSKISQGSTEDQQQTDYPNDDDVDVDVDVDSDGHYESTVRLVQIDKTPNGACGFNLTRTKWDPYPWVV